MAWASVRQPTSHCMASDSLRNRLRLLNKLAAYRLLFHLFNVSSILLHEDSSCSCWYRLTAGTSTTGWHGHLRLWLFRAATRRSGYRGLYIFLRLIYYSSTSSLNRAAVCGYQRLLPICTSAPRVENESDTQQHCKYTCLQYSGISGARTAVAIIRGDVALHVPLLLYSPSSCCHWLLSPCMKSLCSTLVLAHVAFFCLSAPKDDLQITGIERGTVDSYLVQQELC